MIMEFLGVPGCGKTSVMRSAVESLLQKGHPCYDIFGERFVRDQDGTLKKAKERKSLGKGCGRYYFYPGNLRRGFQLLLLFLQGKPRNRAMAIRYRLYYQLIVHYDAVKCRGDKAAIYITDHGLAQQIVSIEKVLEHKPANLVEGLIKLVDMKAEATFVRLKTPPEVACTRIYSRDKHLSIMEHGREAALNNLEREDILFDYIGEGMKSKGRLVTIKENDVDERVKEVLHLLEERQ